MDINFILIVTTLQSTELNSGLSHGNRNLTYEKVKELILPKTSRSFALQILHKCRILWSLSHQAWGPHLI